MEDTKKLEKAPEIQQEGDQEKSPDESELDPDLKELAKQLDNELDVDVTQRRGGEEIQQEVDQEKSPDESELEPKLKELVEQFKNELEVHVTQQRGGEESHEIQGNKESTETTNVMTIQESEQLVAEIQNTTPCAACALDDLRVCEINCPFKTYFSLDNIDEYNIMTGLYKRQTITEWIKLHPKSKWKEFFDYRIQEAKFSDKKRLGGTANEIHKRDRKIAKLERDNQQLRKSLQDRENAANTDLITGFGYPPSQYFLYPPPTQTPTFQIPPNWNLASTTNSQNPQNWNLASTSYSQIPPNWNLASTSYSQIPPNWNLASTSNSQNNPNWNLASTSNSQNNPNWNVASSTSNSQKAPNYEYMGTYIPVEPIHPIYNPYEYPFNPNQSPIYPPEFSQIPTIPTNTSQIPTRPTNNRTNRGFIIREPQQEETQGDERQNAEQP